MFRSIRSAFASAVPQHAGDAALLHRIAAHISAGPTARRFRYAQPKKLLGNASGVLDKFVGGWQIAGSGSLRSTLVRPTGG